MPNFRFRQIQTSPGNFHRLPRATGGGHFHLYTYMVGAKKTIYLGRKPKFIGQYLPKISASSAAYPDFSFRQLPSASVDKENPSPHISLGGRRQCMWEGGWKPKFLGQYLPKIRVFSAAYPNFGFRQLPSASVGSLGLPWTMGTHLRIYYRNADINVFRMGA